MKTILIYYEKNCSSAPRVDKQLCALLDKYKVLLATQEYNGRFVKHKNLYLLHLEQGKSNYTFHLSYPLFLRKIISLLIHLKTLALQIVTFTYVNRNSEPFWTSNQKKVFKNIQKKQFNLIITHHVSSLPLAVRLKKKKKCNLILNAHEYYPLEFENDTEWLKREKPKVDRTCSKYLPHVDELFSVGEIIGEKYKEEFELKGFTFIPNDKPYFELNPVKTTYPIKLIHHGVAARGRQLEKMIQVMNYLDPQLFQLDFMLAGAGKAYINELKLMTNNMDNVQIIPPVPMDEIVSHIAHYDLGLYILSNSNYNNTYALPNKFFEFLQAKLCITISPNPEMARLVQKHDIGIVSKNFNPRSMAEEIRNLTLDKLDEIRQNCVLASKKLASQKTEELIQTQVEILVN